MGPRLQALLELQDVEAQMQDIQQQLGRRERSVAAQDKKLAELRRVLENEQAEMQRLQIQFDQVDLDLKARQGHLDKLRERLNSVRTNKEYAATLSELNNDKADANKVEARAMEIMQQIDEQRTAFDARKKDEAHELQRRTDLQLQLDQARESFSSRLNKLKAKRGSVTERVKPEDIALFERLAERYEGEALAEIERTHPRRDEFTCGGCFMSLSAEVANAVLTRDEVSTCNNCGRILWMQK